MDAPSSVSTGPVALPVDSHEALTTQISELTALVQSLRHGLLSSSTAIMASLGLLLMILYLLMDLLDLSVVKALFIQLHPSPYPLVFMFLRFHLICFLLVN
ncbi:uncharacterized protein LOC114263340 [Camellia sinensis]|uniref:uncharacterized protein LOC114263340 n=1 Tax=Camellia sinensis TaxID=4442 RepID=UPI001036C9DD|nr:uncharacterized protein LOC114263340 [Camellia sinensis]